MKYIYLLLIFVIVIVALGIIIFGGKKDITEDSSNLTLSIEDNLITTENLVVYSDSGYTPSSLTVNKGDTVTFKNLSSFSTWPASNPHPIHTSYPGSSIQKCGGDELIFDSCRVLLNGEEWEFTFNEVGSWRYHDHIKPSKQGVIIVK